jgi:hypothetical protein
MSSSQTCINPTCSKEFSPLSGQHDRKFCCHECYTEYRNTIKTPTRRNIVKQDLLIDLRRVYEILGRAPLLTEYEKYGKYGKTTIYRCATSFPQACRDAGFEPAFVPKPGTLNPNLLIDDIHRLWKELNRFPTWTDYQQYGYFSVISPRKVFGSFHKALLAAGIDPTPSDNWDISQVSDADGHWLSGFAEGEGCFTFSRHYKGGYNVNFKISQRVDRIDAIREVCRILGIPDTYIEIGPSNGPNKNKIYLPSATLNIKDVSVTALRLCPLFDKFPLRGKKGEDYRVFRSAIHLMWRKIQKGGKRRFLIQENRALSKLSQISHLIKQPNISLKNVKSTMLLLDSDLRNQEM